MPAARTGGSSRRGAQAEDDDARGRASPRMERRGGRRGANVARDDGIDGAEEVDASAADREQGDDNDDDDDQPAVRRPRPPRSRSASQDQDRTPRAVRKPKLEKRTAAVAAAATDSSPQRTSRSTAVGGGAQGGDGGLGRGGRHAPATADVGEDGDAEDGRGSPTQTVQRILDEARRERPLDRSLGDSRLRAMRTDWVTAHDGVVEVMANIVDAAERVSEWVPDGGGTRPGVRDHAVLQQLDRDMRALLDGAAEIEIRQRALEQIRASLNRGEAILDAQDRYKAHVSEGLGKYLSKTSRQRYAQERPYNELREKIWSARCADAMPPILDFIPAEDGDDEDEEDIVVGGRTFDYRCPLTAAIMEDPVRSTVCPHTYSRAAILEYLGNGAKECPASGCRERLVASKLREDAKLARDVKTFARRQRERERERMRTQQTGALSIDDDDEE